MCSSRFCGLLASFETAYSTMIFLANLPKTISFLPQNYNTNSTLIPIVYQDFFYVPDMKTFSCPKCSKKFPNANSLEVHLRAECFSTKQLFGHKQLIPTKQAREEIKSPLGVLAAIAKTSTDFNNALLFEKSIMFG